MQLDSITLAGIGTLAECIASAAVITRAERSPEAFAEGTDGTVIHGVHREAADKLSRTPALLR